MVQTFQVMEKSQSSNESTDNCSMTFTSMDTASYKSLLAKTRESLGSDATELEVTSFTTLLKNYSSCINQSLYVVTVLLSEPEVCTNKLAEFLNDAVYLLELLFSFLKTIMSNRSELLTCYKSKTFPTTVGLVIVSVFSHCKDSVTLYGSNLISVEEQLKELFRNCQELQLTYLMILEKHFTFDLTDLEEKNILLETLDINLKISDTVQSLDVKALAVQWKALTEIYQKYSNILTDTSIFQDCMSILCPLIKSHIETAVEANQDDKVIRSLKVANFLLKALLKVCNILGHTARKEYTNVINLLFYVNETNVHLDLTAERSQFINLIESSECLLKKLLYDETFAHGLLNYDLEKIKQDGSFLGFALTITCAMDCLTQDHKNKTVTKSQMINCLYDILSGCDSWNLDVTLWSHNKKSHGLFEHLLIHSLALALTLNCEEYSFLEKKMVEAILSTNHTSALFSTSVWTLLHMAKDVNPQLLFNQIVWLCTMYKKLEKHSMFQRSPQKSHLAHTISRLFNLMEIDDKMKICKQFRIHDDDNLTLWTALRVKSLPQEAKNAAEAVVVVKLKSQFQYLDSSIGPKEIDKLTEVMGLAATCAFTKASGIEDHIMQAWSKTCPKRLFAIQHVYGGTTWFYDYLQALIALTDSMWQQLCLKNVNLIKILHCVTSLIEQCGVEFKLLFINALCKLATTDICDSKIDNFKSAFTCLYTSGDIVRKKLFIALKQNTHKNIELILSKVGDHTLRDSWSKTKDGNSIDINDKLKDCKYIHKCLENSDTIGSKNSRVKDLKKSTSGNFDFADNVYDLFGNDSDIEESACKKVKFDSSVVEAVIKRLENETAVLRTMKENVFSAACRSRIQNICDDLNSLIN